MYVCCWILSVKVWPLPEAPWSRPHMAFLSSARASCAISGIYLSGAGPCSSVLYLFLSLTILSHSLPLIPSTVLVLCLSPLLFFFWPGRPSQCEIMVNAPWQSDTTHSPGLAPSGFNLIWSENGGGGWWWWEWRAEMKAGCVIFRRIASPSFILPKLTSSPHTALTPLKNVWNDSCSIKGLQKYVKDL